MPSAVPRAQAARPPHSVRRLAAAATLLAAPAGPLRLHAQSAGAPTPPAVPAPGPLARHLDLARLRPRADSFAVVVQGVARGWQRVTVARDDSGWVLTDATSIPPMLRQESRIRLDPGLAERGVRQEGEAGGAPMRIAVDFAGGRAQGTALTPEQAGSPLAIARAVPEGTVDDNAVFALLPAVRWRADLDVAFPVLLSGKGTVITQRLRVLGADSVTVPAGRFATWRAELSGGPVPVLLDVTRAAPAHVVRARPVGVPFEVHLVR